MIHTLTIESGTKLENSTLATVPGNNPDSCSREFFPVKYHVLRSGLRLCLICVVLSVVHQSVARRHSLRGGEVRFMLTSRIFEIISFYTYYRSRTRAMAFTLDLLTANFILFQHDIATPADLQFPSICPERRWRRRQRVVASPRLLRRSHLVPESSGTLDRTAPAMSKDESVRIRIEYEFVKRVC